MSLSNPLSLAEAQRHARSADTVLLMAKAIDGLGWTDEDGKFDKLKMADGVLKN